MDDGDARVTQTVTPFNHLLAQLSQGMSAQRGQRVVNEFGWQSDAQHTTEERVVWIPAPLGVESQAFQLPGMVTPWRQASRFDVSLYGSSYDRLLEIHSLLVAWLDLLVGPPMGNNPSDDAAPAIIRGHADLALLTYPYSGLIGKTLDFSRPLKRTLTFPGTPIANVRSIAAAINAASVAAAQPIRARIAFDGDEAYLELLYPTDSLVYPIKTSAPEVGASLSMFTTTPTSAAGIFGIHGEGDEQIATGIGTAPSTPYRPGYSVGSATPGPRGMNLESQACGAIVPVVLYRPIVSLQYLVGVILETPFEVLVAGGSEPDETETVVSTS